MPYYRAAEHVEEAIDSLFAQTHRRVDAIVVNDGSFEEADEVLLRLAERPGVRVVTQLNGGEATARNLAVKLAEGEYLVMLDADNVLEPEFLERALETLRREPALAYVSCWLRFIGPDGSPYEGSVGCAHIGNRVMRDDSVNWDGDTLALIPSELLSDLGFFHDREAATHTDWEFYRRLRDLGRFGTVVPEMLARYRVRPESLMRTWGDDTVERGWRESRDRRIERQVEWEGSAGRWLMSEARAGETRGSRNCCASTPSSPPRSAAWRWGGRMSRAARCSGPRGGWSRSPKNAMPPRRELEQQNASLVELSEEVHELRRRIEVQNGELERLRAGPLGLFRRAKASLLRSRSTRAGGA